MGNTSTIEYDNVCYNTLLVDDIEFVIDCYIEKRWFIFKLTKTYELLICEIIKGELLDIKYFDLEYPLQDNMLNLYTELHTSYTTISERIIIRQCSLRRTENNDIKNQINILEEIINKKTDNKDIQKYLDILNFFTPFNISNADYL